MEVKTTISGTLVINVDSARDLPNEDIYGFSDPYCIVTVSQDKRELYKGQTQTIENNLNPSWKAKFIKHLSHLDQHPIKVDFLINDEDVGMTDDYLGECSYEISPMEKLYDKVLRLKVTDPKHQKNRGELAVVISFVPDDLAKKSHLGGEDYVFPNGKETNLILGPVLQFRGNEPREVYSIAMVVVVEGEGGDTPLLMLNTPVIDNLVDVKKLASLKGKHVWRYTLSVQRTNKPHSVKYSLNNKHYQFEVPGFGEPLRCVFISCNGFHEEPEGLKNDKYHMWNVINDNHGKNGGYHLILQGGDQVYSDPVFKSVQALRGIEAGHLDAINLTVDEQFLDEVETFYFNIYVNSWSTPFMAQGLASIPSIMMWDDHDIFDGWGSYPENLLRCPSYTALYKMAEKYFCVFQLASTLEEINSRELKTTLPGKHSGKSQVYRIDDTVIVGLDLRTERTMKLVCSNETYSAYFEWLAQNPHFEHLYLLLSIPIVYNDFDVLEKAIERTSLGEELLDDLRDHWRTADHYDERLVLIKHSITSAMTQKYRITILSGDVHIGCAGVIFDKIKKIKTNAAVINCLISSAVVNVPPPPTVVQVLELTGGEIEEIPNPANDGWALNTGLYRFHHDVRKNRYIPGRNYLELLANDHKGILCKWYAEGEEDRPYEHYIHGYVENDNDDMPLFPDDAKYIRQTLSHLASIPAQTIQSWFT